MVPVCVKYGSLFETVIRVIGGVEKHRSLDVVHQMFHDCCSFIKKMCCVLI